MNSSKLAPNDPTWRPPRRQEGEPQEGESGTFPIRTGRFEPVRMPRQSITARGSRLTPVRARTIRERE